MSATTSNRGYTYPQSTDDFRPYEDIQQLAEDVDADMDTQVGRIATLEDYIPKSVRKTADTGRSSTTPSADPHLLITLPAGIWYVVFGRVGFNGDTGGDMKGGLYGPSGCTYAGGYSGQPSTASAASGSVLTDQVGLGNSYVWGTVGTGQNLGADFHGLLYSGDGGDFGFTWGRNAAATNNTTVLAGSFFHLMPAAV